MGCVRKDRILSIAFLLLFLSLGGSQSAWSDDGDSARVPLVEFRNVLLNDAIRIFSEQTGLNLVASLEAGKVPVSIFLRNVPARSAIEELCKSHNLWYKEDKTSGIIRIMTTREFQQDLTSFREEQTEVFTLLYPNALSIALAIRDLYGDRVQLSLNREENTDDTQELTSRFDRFNIVDQRGYFQTNTQGGAGSGFGTGIGPLGSQYGATGANVGGIGVLGGSGYNAGNISQSYADTGRNARTREQYPDEQKTLTSDQAQILQNVIAKGGTPEEAQTYLESFRKKPYVNTFVTFSRRNNSVMVRSSDRQTLEQIRKLIARLDVPTSTVLLEVKVLSLDLSDDFNSAFDFQFNDGTSGASFSSGDILPSPSTLLRGTARKFASLTPGGTAIQAGDLTYQYVSQNFRTRIQLLQSKNKVTTLATPTIMTANNEVSRIFVGQQQPIVSGISSQTVVNSNISTSTPNTSFNYVPVGTTLLITPNINSDRTITLRILQENSSIVTGGASIPVVNSNGSVQQTPIDIVSTRTVSGTVVAKDDLSLVVGGLIQDNVSDIRSMVPALGKVPVVGYFFRRQTTTRGRQELIVVIKPHILSTPCEAEGISKKLLNDLSIHPKAQNTDGTLDTFLPREVLVPHPPRDKKADVIQLDNTKPNE